MPERFYVHVLDICDLYIVCRYRSNIPGYVRVNQSTRYMLQHLSHRDMQYLKIYIFTFITLYYEISMKLYS